MVCPKSTESENDPQHAGQGHGKHHQFWDEIEGKAQEVNPADPQSKYESEGLQELPQEKNAGQDGEAGQERGRYLAEQIGVQK